MYYNGAFTAADSILTQLKKNMAGVYDIKKLNTNVINNIYKLYLVNLKYFSLPEIIKRSGIAVQWSAKTYLFADRISKKLNLPKLLILNYFLVIYDLSKAGTIPLKYYDPYTAQEAEKTKEKMDPGVFYNIAKSGSKVLTKVSIIAVSAGVIYLLYKFKKR